MFSRTFTATTRSISTSSCLPRIVPGSLESRECVYPIAGKKPCYANTENAFKDVKSGDQIFVHQFAATPTPLLQGLCEHVKAHSLNKITLHHLLLEGPTPWTDPQYKGRIRSNSLFTGANLRGAVNNGVADFNSIFLSEVPLLFQTGAIKLDVALIQVSPPDANGFCSLGICVDTTRAAVTHARRIIAMSNKNMPRTFGDSVIHESHIDLMVECNDHQLYERHFEGAPSAAEKQIGKLIADNLVADGATLQLGYGAIPDAALAEMQHHKDLSVHTELFSDGLLDLIESNVVTNAKKELFPGKTVTSLVYGSKRLFNFCHNNPTVFFGECSWTNDPEVIRTLPRMTAINSAIEVDLTGQVVADSIGPRFYSGIGGQVDFITGAATADDGLGKPIIAMLSTTEKGESKIVPFIHQGSGVVTPRAQVHYVVTEYGIAQLWGRNMRQRAYELIKIAHPEKRAELERAAYARLKVMPSAD